MRSRRIRTFIIMLFVAAPLAGAAQPVPGPAADPVEPIAAPETPPDPETLRLGTDAAATLPARETRALGGEKEPSSIGMSRTLGALVGVVGVMLVLFLGFRRLATRRGGLIASLGAAGRAPSGIIEVLARYPIARTQRIVVLRIGRRVVVCCQSAGGRAAHGGMTTLTELTDPEEVAALLRSVRDIDGTSNNAAFKRALKDAENDPDTAPPGPLGPLGYESTEGDTVQWRDERIHIPTGHAASRHIDPSIGRMRARLAAMRNHGDAA